MIFFFGTVEADKELLNLFSGPLFGVKIFVEWKGGKAISC